MPLQTEVSPRIEYCNTTVSAHRKNANITDLSNIKLKRNNPTAHSTDILPSLEGNMSINDSLSKFTGGPTLPSFKLIKDNSKVFKNYKNDRVKEMEDNDIVETNESRN